MRKAYAGETGAAVAGVVQAYKLRSRDAYGWSLIAASGRLQLTSARCTASRQFGQHPPRVTESGNPGYPMSSSSSSLTGVFLAGVQPDGSVRYRCGHRCALGPQYCAAYYDLHEYIIDSLDAPQRIQRSEGHCEAVGDFRGLWFSEVTR
jgi:hypothetical protein